MNENPRQVYKPKCTELARKTFKPGYLDVNEALFIPGSNEKESIRYINSVKRFNFRCCLHVGKLEHNFFSQSQNRNLAPKLTMTTNKGKSSPSPSDRSISELLNLTFDPVDDTEIW